MRSIYSQCRKVVCIGRNYADHIKELNHTRPLRPFFFLKPPSSLLEPGNGPVLRPRGIKLHYEVELALIMGRRFVDEHVEEAGKGQRALDAIEGYALAIDMTARNLQDDCRKVGLPWTSAKGFDTFCPISRMIPKKTIPDPQNVNLWLNVNGQQRQSDSTSLMLFDIPRLLGEISSVMTLEPGDIVLTGTPKGVGEVRAGDTMHAGMQVMNKEVEAANIEVSVEDRQGSYSYP